MTRHVYTRMHDVFVHRCKQASCLRRQACVAGSVSSCATHTIRLATIVVCLVANRVTRRVNTRMHDVFVHRCNQASCLGRQACVAGLVSSRAAHSKRTMIVARLVVQAGSGREDVC